MPGEFPLLPAPLREALVKSAVKEYGREDTEHCEGAGYILPDGTLLRMVSPDSEEEVRNYEHWSILAAIPKSLQRQFHLDWKNATGAFEQMTGAMRTGWGPAWGFAEFARPPTPAQVRAIGDCACAPDGLGSVPDLMVERVQGPRVLNEPDIGSFSNFEVLHADTKHCGTIRREIQAGIAELLKE